MGETFVDPYQQRSNNANDIFSRMWEYEDKEILKLRDRRDALTIAHIQVVRGWRTEDREILSLRDWEDSSVADLQLKNGWEPKTPEAKAYVLAERLKG